MASERDAAARVRETYVAALRHDRFDPAGATLVGVVRRPTGWFRAEVDENRPELGPPSALLEETKETAESFRARGMCDSGAHNAAWEEADFEERYREHLDADEAASAALEELTERVRDGEDLALVCFEGDGKRCHRHLLRELVGERLES